MRPGYGSLFVLTLTIALSAITPLPASAWTAVSNCLGCHTDFSDGSPSMHDLHATFTNDCRDCHQASFSTALSTNNSANYPDYSCNGCHELAGLVTKHVAASASCGCHSGVVGTSAGEHVLPYFYTGGRSSIVNPCRTNPENGGEDWDGDGFGLDNDGDGNYDAADSDCDGIVPLTVEDWSTLKTLFEHD